MPEREVTIPYNGAPARAVVVPMDSIHEQQSQYQLADGSILQLRTVVLQVFRLKDHFNAENDPIYVVKSQNMVTTVVPDHLKKRE